MTLSVIQGRFCARLGLAEICEHGEIASMNQIVNGTPATGCLIVIIQEARPR